MPDRPDPIHTPDMQAPAPSRCDRPPAPRRVPRARACLLAVVLSAAWAPAETPPPGPGRSSQPARLAPDAEPAEPERPPETDGVDYLPIRLAGQPDKTLMFQAGIELRDRPHTWFRVVFAICQGRNRPLNVAGKDLWVWGHLFSPAGPARWTDIRFGFAREHLAQLNLPRGKTHLVWAVCKLQDAANESDLGDPWTGALPIRLTFDKLGRLDRLDVLQLDPARPPKGHPIVRIPAVEAALAQSPLQLAEGVELYRATDPAGHRHALLRAGDEVCPLDHPARGRFFSRIESADQARRLVQLGYPGSVLIGSPEQLQALARAAGAKSPAEAKAGCRSEPIEPMGFEVKMLLALANADGLLDRIVRVRTLVARDGRMGTRIEDLIPAPADGAESAARNRAFRAAMLQGQHLRLQPSLQPRGPAVRIPCPPHRRKGDWLDPDNWAGTAGR